MERHLFLKIAEYCLSTKVAEKLVDQRLKLMNIKIPSKSKSKEIITFEIGQKKRIEKHKYTDLVRNTRIKGVVTPVQKIIDAGDIIYGGIFSMSTNSSRITLNMTYAGFSKEIKGPGRIHPIEHEISNDILFYREEACIESDNHDLEMTSRNYRGYLFSCISLIDGYINRHILYGKYSKIKNQKFKELINCLNMEKRIQLFLEIFCKSSIEEINKSSAWSDFKLLKGIRNELVHAKSPFLGVTIKEIADNLNLCNRGIGEILKCFQELQGRNSLGFIEEIRNAPKVYQMKKINK